MAYTTRDEVATKVLEIVQGSFEGATLSSDFAADLGADSLDTVELVMEMEEEFDVKIQDDEAEQLKTVQSVVDFVAKQLKLS
jgi:acyl carrier protein